MRSTSSGISDQTDPADIAPAVTMALSAPSQSIAPFRASNTLESPPHRVAADPNFAVNITDVTTLAQANNTFHTSRVEGSQERSLAFSSQQGVSFNGLLIDQDSSSEAELPSTFLYVSSREPSPSLSPMSLEQIEAEDSSPMAEASQDLLESPSQVSLLGGKSGSREGGRAGQGAAPKAGSGALGRPRIFQVPSCFSDENHFNSKWYNIRVLGMHTNPENTPRGSYRDQHGQLHFDYTWPVWRNWVEESLGTLGYPRTAQIEAWIGTDYFDPEQDDEGVFPNDARIIRDSNSDYTVGRNLAISEWIEDSMLQESGYPTFNRNIPSVPPPGSSHPPSFPTRSSPNHDDNSTPSLPQDPFAPHRIDTSASKGKGKAALESEPSEDQLGDDGEAAL